MSRDKWFNDWKRLLFPVAIGLGCFIVYFISMPKTLSWGLNDYGIDSPEFLTAAMLWSNPHPPGYPLYSLILRGFIEIAPIGDIAFRGNLLSVLFGSFTASLLYVLIMQSIKLCRDELSDSWQEKSTALFGVMVFVFCPLVWGTSVVTEVYSLNSFFCVVLLLFFINILKTKQLPSEGISDYARGFFLISGFAIANHLTVLAIILPISGYILLLYRRNLLAFVFTVLLFIPGLLFYIYLPIRAIDPHATNWGDARTLEGLFWMLRGGPYGAYLVPGTQDAISDRVIWGLNTLYAILNPLALAFVASGFFIAWERSKALFFVALISAFLFLSYAIFYRTIDAEVNILPSVLIFAIMSSFSMLYLITSLMPWKFISGLNPRLRGLMGSRHIISVTILALSCLVIFTPAIWQFSEISRANNNDPLIRGRELLKSSSQGGIIFLTREHDVFPTWYVNYVDFATPHAVPLAIPLLQYKWYWENAVQKGAGVAIPFESDLLTAIEKIYKFSSDSKDVFVIDASIREQFQTKETGKLYQITGTLR